MSENDVKVIVIDAFKEYERETGLPRHNENLGNFTAIFRVMNRIQGAAALLILMVGIPGCVASILVIVSKLKGH